MLPNYPTTWSIYSESEPSQESSNGSATSSSSNPEHVQQEQQHPTTSDPGTSPRFLHYPTAEIYPQGNGERIPRIKRSGVQPADEHPRAAATNDLETQPIPASYVVLDAEHIPDSDDAAGECRTGHKSRWSCCCGLVLRHPYWCLLVSLLAYPAIFVPMVAFGNAWPVQLGPIEDLTRSSVQSYVEYTRLNEILATLKTGAALDANSSTVAIPNRRLLQSVSRAKIEIFYSTSSDNQDVFQFIDFIKEFESLLVPAQFCPGPTAEEVGAYQTLGLKPGNCSSTYPLRDTPVNYFFPTTVKNPAPGISVGIMYDGKSTSPARDESEVYDEWLETRNARFLPRVFTSSNVLSMTRSTFMLQSSDYSQLKGFINGDLYSYLVSQAGSAPSGLAISWNYPDLLSEELSLAVVHDAILATGSIGVVGVMMFLLLNFDLFLTLIGLIALAFALPMAYAFFIVVFGYKDIFSLSFLSLYVLFGVGSDCCFIYQDEMGETLREGEEEKDRPAILFHGWRRATSATFVTMSTTAVSFFANVGSPISVVKEWGIFMGLVTSFAWMTVATIFPCALIARRVFARVRTRHRGAIWFRDVFALFINRFRYVLFLACLALAVVSAALMFANNRLGTTSDSVPRFFDPRTSNLGRIFTLKDEFDWVAGGTNIGTDGPTYTGLACQAPEYVLDASKTRCIKSCPDPCSTFRWWVVLAPVGDGTFNCICTAPKSSVEDFVSSNSNWPRAGVQLLEPRCASCNVNSNSTFLFSSASSTDFTSLKATLSQLRPGDQYFGATVIATSLVSSAAPTKSPSRPPSTNPPTSTLNPTVFPSTQAPTFKPTSKAPTAKPTTATSIPTLATTFSPSVPPTTEPPTKKTTQPPNGPPSTDSPVTMEPTVAPTSSLPTNAPTTSMPSKAPTTSSPSRRPSRSPTSSAPTTSPSTSTPSFAPSTRPTKQPTRPPTSRPTQSPFQVPHCPGDCSGRGKCDTTTLTCTCNLGSTGSNCSETIETGVSDSIAESVSFGFGLDRSNGDGLDQGFDIAASTEDQEYLMGVCALLCYANNETAATSGSRCASFIFSRYNNETKLKQILQRDPLPYVDVKQLAYRRLTGCAIADFAEFILGTGGVFPVSNKQKFLTLLRNYTTAQPDKIRGGLLGLDSAGGLRFVRMDAMTSLSSKNTPAVEAVGASRAWRALLDDLAQGRTRGMDPIIGSSLFARSETEMATISGFASSWVSTTVVAILAILLYTQSFAMAVFTGLSMTGVLLCAFGFCFYCLGWTFGLIEAVGLTIIVGLTVDFSAHLCYAFIVSSSKMTALQRTQEALGKVGLAICSSALTTIGACSLLFATVILPFQKFGAIVCATMVLSVIYSFAFLCPMFIFWGWIPTRVWEWTKTHLLCCLPCFKPSKSGNAATAE